MRKLASLFSNKLVIVCGLAALMAYSLYLNGISTNPPGFYLDESFISYQAYLISQTGRNDQGEFLPTYFRAFANDDGTFDSYMNAPYIYGLALLNLYFPPSFLLSRTFSVTLVFLGCLLLGLLAARMSERPAVGILIACTALVTPWFFELSRLVFEVAFYPLALCLFLLALLAADRATRWTWGHASAVAVGLALVTYSYTTGRLLGPAFALGLILFGTNRYRLISVAKTWGIYAVLVLPAVVYAYNNPGAMTGRYEALSIFKPEMGLFEKITTFAGAYLTDIGFNNLLVSGDPFLRHHVAGTGMLMAATVLIGVIGVASMIMRARREPWYRHLLFGLVVSVVPGALTMHRSHMLRLSAFPVFFLLAGVPVLEWLLSVRRGSESQTGDESVEVQTETTPVHPGWSVPPWLRLAGLAILLVSVAVQAVIFQKGFRAAALTRGPLFDENYPVVFAEAINRGDRPIYLEDGSNVPASIHAYFFGATQKIDRASFVRLKPGGIPPAGSLVISTEKRCENCNIVYRRGIYLLYTTK